MVLVSTSHDPGWVLFLNRWHLLFRLHCESNMPLCNHAEVVDSFMYERALLLIPGSLNSAFNGHLASFILILVIFKVT